MLEGVPHSGPSVGCTAQNINGGFEFDITMLSFQRTAPGFFRNVYRFVYVNSQCQLCWMA